MTDILHDHELRVALLKIKAYLDLIYAEILPFSKELPKWDTLDLEQQDLYDLVRHAEIEVTSIADRTQSYIESWDYWTKTRRPS